MHRQKPFRRLFDDPKRYDTRLFAGAFSHRKAFVAPCYRGIYYCKIIPASKCAMKPNRFVPAVLFPFFIVSYPVRMPTIPETLPPLRHTLRSIPEIKFFQRTCRVEKISM